jgi:PKD repeat protein
VSLVVTDARGAVSAPKTDIVNVRPKEEEPVEPNAPPRADFRMSTRSGPAPLTVTFSNRSYDPDGNPIRSLWDFGDGTTSTEINPTHTYTTPGEYHVSLVVTDSRGAVSAPKTDIVNVRPAEEEPVEENAPPRADFRMDVRSGPAPLTVAFSNRSADPDGDAFTSHWDFGDGTSSSELNPTHTYTTPGDYQVTLVVTDAHGAASAPKRDYADVR